MATKKSPSKKTKKPSNKKSVLEKLRAGATAYSGAKTERVATTCDPTLRKAFDRVAKAKGLTPATALRFAMIDYVDKNG